MAAFDLDNASDIINELNKRLEDMAIRAEKAENRAQEAEKKLAKKDKNAPKQYQDRNFHLGIKALLTSADSKVDVKQMYNDIKTTGDKKFSTDANTQNKERLKNFNRQRNELIEAKADVSDLANELIEWIEETYEISFDDYVNNPDEPEAENDDIDLSDDDL